MAESKDNIARSFTKRGATSVVCTWLGNGFTTYLNMYGLQEDCNKQSGLDNKRITPPQAEPPALGRRRAKIPARRAQQLLKGS